MLDSDYLNFFTIRSIPIENIFIQIYIMDKRHFTVVEKSGKEHGLYVSSTPSSAAKKAVSKLCASNKSKKVEFYLREITQGSKKKTYGLYQGEMKKLKTPIELKGRVIQYEIKVHLKKVQKSMKGGESEALKAILEIAKQKFFKEYKFNANNKSTILGIMQSLPEHKSVSHTPIEENWKDGAEIVDEIRDGKRELIAHFYKTPVRLRKSATSKTIREILSGLLDESIEIRFTWTSNYNMVFVNFFSTISDDSPIKPGYVHNVYEPCTPGGDPIKEAPPYSYYDSKYHIPKPDETPPYLIISREFTNQIYGWLGRGNNKNFKPKLDTLTDESELPLRFSYELTES